MIPLKWLILGGAAVVGAVSAWLSANRETAEETNAPETVPYDSPEIPRHENVPAQVACIRHEHDPLRMVDGARVTFSLPEEKITFSITGEGAYHIAEGDEGLLTWVGDTLVSFEMTNGDTVTAQFYLPADTEESHE